MIKNYKLILMELVLVAFCSASLAYVIDESGIHILGGELEETGDGITITVDNVELNLDGNRVAGGTNGIVVNANVSHIIIRNGRVINSQGSGILVNAGVQDIVIEDMSIQNCTAGGIVLDGLLTNTIGPAAIKNCSIMSCTGSFNLPARGIALKYVQNFTVDNCCLVENDASLTNSGFGLLIEDCQIGKVFDCSINETGGDVFGLGAYILSSTNILVHDTLAVQSIARSTGTNETRAAGFYVQHCQDVILNDCQALDTLNTGSALAAGFIIENSENIIMQKCQGLAACCSVGSKAAGFLLTTGTGNIVRDCSAENNKSTFDIAVGFELAQQTKSCIENSSAKLNKTVVTGIAYGIFLSGADNNNCYVASNNIINNEGIDGSFGIVDERSLSTSFFQRNDAFNNGTNYSISYPSTITLARLIGSLSDPLIGISSGIAGNFDNGDVTP